MAVSPHLLLGFGPEALAGDLVRLGLQENEGGDGSYVVLGFRQEVRKFLLLGLIPAGTVGGGGSYVTLGTGQNVYLHELLGLTPGSTSVKFGPGQATESFTVTGSSYRHVYGFGLGSDDAVWGFTVAGTAAINGPLAAISASAALVTWQGRIADIQFPGGQNITGSAASQSWVGLTGSVFYTAGYDAGKGVITWTGQTATIYAATVIEPTAAAFIRWAGARATVAGTNLPRSGGRIRIIRGKRYMIYGGN